MRALFHTFSSRDALRASTEGRPDGRPRRSRAAGARSPARRARWPAGRCPATSRRRHRRPSASGGAAPAARPTRAGANHVALNGAYRRQGRHACDARRRPAPSGGEPATRGPTSFTASARPSATPRRVTSRATTAPRTHGNVTRSSTCSPSGSRSTARRCTGWGRPRSGRRSTRIAREAGARADRNPGGSAREEWRPRCGTAARARRGRPPLGAELDALDGALTGCAVAIAEVGAFVLDGGPGQGRRALSARSGPSHLRRPRGSGRGSRSGGGCGARSLGHVGQGAHVRGRPVGHLRHRARPGRGGSRSADAARGGRRLLMRTVYLGTSDFAATVLDRLAASAHRPQLVVTRPDARRGRGRRLAPPPVAETRAPARDRALPAGGREQRRGPRAHRRGASPRRSPSAPTARSSRSRSSPSTRC